MNGNTAPGTRLGDFQPRPKWLDFKLSNWDLSVGDLVTYSFTSYSNGMTLYRIVKDCPPNEDLVWTQVKSPYGFSSRYASRYSWTKPGNKTPVPDIRVRGCIELTPVLQIFPGPPSGKRTVAYSKLGRVKKVDVLALGKSFSSFQDFINEEIKRLTGT